jgi:archaemetzincin
MVEKLNGIGLVTFGEVDREELSFLPAALQDIMGLPAEWGQSLSIPEGSYRDERRQYIASSFIKALADLTDDGFLRLLGITGEDLFTQGLNFIFGQAVIGGRESLISLARLRPSFYGQPDHPGFFRERVIKEAVHELGHTFGLSHCGDPTCVMMFSNSLSDTDRKSSGFCRRCQGSIQV